MNAIDFLLNAAGSLLWISWLGQPRERRLASGRGVSLAAALRSANRRQDSRWPAFLGVALLLLARPYFYWHLGSSLDWVPVFQPFVPEIPFRSDFYGRMAAYSTVSFLWFLGAVYLNLWFVHFLSGNASDPSPIQRTLINALGPAAALPRPIQVLIPGVVVALAWPPFIWALDAVAIYPAAEGTRAIVAQSGLLALHVYLQLRWIVVAILVLHAIHTYVYLGNNPTWKFLERAGKNLMRPAAWIPAKIGRFDFTPLILAPLLLVAADYAELRIERAFAATEAYREAAPSQRP